MREAKQLLLAVEDTNSRDSHPSVPSRPPQRQRRPVKTKFAALPPATELGLNAQPEEHISWPCLPVVTKNNGSVGEDYTATARETSACAGNAQQICAH